MTVTRIALYIFFCVALLTSCKKDPPHEKPPLPEDPASFKEYASLKLGGEASAEISAYDPETKRLFTVNNEAGAKVDIIDLGQFPAINKIQSLNFSASGAANSVAVHDGLLAVALEALNKQDNGKIAILNTSTLAELKQVLVGALPDMVTFSPDGRYIVSANEGEPNDAYSNDPAGSISIIDVKNNYSVKTLDFSSFESSQASLKAGGFRVYGLNATLAKDVEPEYITISSNSQIAWATLQENNGVAEIDLVKGIITRIIPLGTKDISLPQNAFDVSDRDNKIELNTWPIKAYYLPDAISYFNVNGTGYLALANEGDTRAYSGLNEEVRVKDLKLDASRFPNASTLKLDQNLGRLTVTKFSGDTDNDGDYDELYATGGRSMTIINAATGQIVTEIGRELEQKVIDAGKYDDTRSDNKGVEVEGVYVSTVHNQTIAFVGMERSNTIAVYDIGDPLKPKFLQLFGTGVAPEGVMLVKAKDSPNGRSLLIVSCEGDGTVKFYQPDTL